MHACTIVQYAALSCEKQQSQNLNRTTFECVRQCGPGLDFVQEMLHPKTIFARPEHILLYLFCLHPAYSRAPNTFAWETSFETPKVERREQEEGRRKARVLLDKYKSGGEVHRFNSRTYAIVSTNFFRLGLNGLGLESREKKINRCDKAPWFLRFVLGSGLRNVPEICVRWFIVEQHKFCYLNARGPRLSVLRREQKTESAKGKKTAISSCAYLFKYIIQRLGINKFVLLSLRIAKFNW